MKCLWFRKLSLLTCIIVFSFSYVITSFANATDESYLEYLQEEIDRTRELIEVTYPAELEELENVTIPALEKELEELQIAHEKDLEENPHNIDTWLEVQVGIKESELNDRKSDINRIQEEIKSQTYALSELEKILEQRTNMAYGNYWTGEVPKDSSGNNRTYKFLIENKSGDYILTAEYRTWNKLMGGSWEYDNAIRDSLKIAFYEDDVCLDSILPRAESYDTETRYAWELPDDLNLSSSHAIEIVGKRYVVDMLNGISEDNDSDDYESDNSLNNDSYVGATEETTNTTSTTDYPGFYDATLADNIPNQSYYAQTTDGGWTVSFGSNAEVNSKYDKSNQRGASDYVKGWLCKDGKWYAFDGDGCQVTGWLSTGGYWYCINPGTTAESSSMFTGWQEINSNWYYFNNSGQMVANCVVDGYSIGADGIWRQ